MNEYIGHFLVGLTLYIIGVTVAAIKANSTMKEQIKTLFSRYDKLENSLDDMRKEKDADIKEIKNEIKTLSDALIEGNQNIVKMIHALDIKLEKRSNGTID